MTGPESKLRIANGVIWTYDGTKIDEPILTQCSRLVKQKEVTYMGKAEKIAAIVMVLEDSTERQVDEVYDFIMDELS